MIDRAGLSQLTPAQRAQVIYTEARSELNEGLWRAALGGGERDRAEVSRGFAERGGGELRNWLAMLEAGGGGVVRSDRAAQTCGHGAPEAADVPPGFGAPAPASGALAPEALGANARHAPAIERAAERTKIPAAALASIVDAEAAKARDGSWNTHSRNPRSSAAGLGQFLSSTWESEAERRGTWLNGVAADRGWLTPSGQVAPGARASLLALRYDAEASIQATADYAKRNLRQLERAGVEIGGDPAGIARAAYLGHHLGPGDAVRFLDGGLSANRARLLLNAQVGSASAERRIAQAGEPAEAHRHWLNSYVERRIRPERFTAA